MQGRTWVIATIVLVLLGFVPSSETVAPDWDVTTLDRFHHPLEGVTVREVWQQYSLEQLSHEEDKLTDDAGRVHFPRRAVRTSVASRRVFLAA